MSHLSPAQRRRFRLARTTRRLDDDDNAEGGPAATGRDFSLVFTLVADHLDLAALAALVRVLGPKPGQSARNVDATIERALLRANHAPLSETDMQPAERPDMFELYVNNMHGGPTMPQFRLRQATPLLEARAMACYIHASAGLSENLPKALNGLYVHGEAYGTKWGAELESSVLVSLPDARVGLKGRRTLVIVSTLFENGCGPECGCAWHEWTIVEARLSDDARGAFTTLVAFQRRGRGESGGYDPWCATCNSAYAEKFAAACGVAVEEQITGTAQLWCVGYVVQFLSMLSSCGRTPAWNKLEERYKQSWLRYGHPLEEDGRQARKLEEEEPDDAEHDDDRSADWSLPRPDEPTAAGDFLDIAFGRPPMDGERPHGLMDTCDSCHLDATQAPRRRLVALCGALPASARRALGPCVVALRGACARCTYEMPFPENNYDYEV